MTARPTDADRDALLAAVRAGDADAVALLLDRGADPNAYTLFDRADPQSRLPALYYACVADQPRVAALLLERGAEPNDGESVYHAAELGHAECLDVLLAHGADISGPHAHYGNTPLHFLAAHVRDDAGIRLLLERGADPDVPSGPRRETALHRVAEQHAPGTAELLLDHGADPDRPRDDGRTPYALAVRCANDAVADLLRTRGAGIRLNQIDTFLQACLQADEPTARRLLPALAAQNRVALDALDAEDRAALAWAALRGREDSVRLMVALGFDLTWDGPGGGTPLHHAAWHGRPATVGRLLELGAPVDISDPQFGASPLGWAAHGSANCRSADDDYREVVELLLAAGATRAAAADRWGTPPEAVASPGVAPLLGAE